MSDWPDSQPIGTPLLIYRYTVTGSDKASIDTGADAADAGSNDWTNCDLLEIIVYARTDEATAASNVAFTFNNDTGSVYDYTWSRVTGTSSAFANAAASANFVTQFPGTTVANTSVPGVAELKVPNPTGTVLNKGFSGTWGFGNPGDTTNMVVATIAGVYRPSTPAALTRLKITPLTGAKKLKIGSQLLIYKRLAS